MLTITAKKDKDGTATILGTQMRLVTTSSMEKSPATDVSGFKVKHIPVNSMVFIDVVPEDPAEAGQSTKAPSPRLCEYRRSKRRCTRTSPL